MKCIPHLLVAAALATALPAPALFGQTAPGGVTASSGDTTNPSLPDWAIGPFTRQANPEPVIKQNPDATFMDPIKQKAELWEKGLVYNPAATVHDGKIVVLYRAQQGGSSPSRVGYAESDDGFHFKCDPEPIYYAADDDQKFFESKACEDPRVAEAPDGSYRMTFSQLGVTGFRIGIASSTDLKHWTKLGSAFAGTKWEFTHIKSAAIVHEVKDGKLVAAKINGKFWMYFGEGAVRLATSDDLTHWKPLETPDGKMLIIMKTRKGFFDSSLTEIGCQSVLTKNGIVVFYNGGNLAVGGDDTIRPKEYCGGQALFDAKDPSHYITRLDKPFIQPAYPWEMTGKYKYGTTFIEGLVLFHNQWFLYFGCADTLVGVASAPFDLEQFALPSTNPAQ